MKSGRSGIGFNTRCSRTPSMWIYVMLALSAMIGTSLATLPRYEGIEGKHFVTFPPTGLEQARTKCTKIGARLPSYGERGLVAIWLGQNNFKEAAWLDLKEKEGIYYVAKPTQGQSSQFIDRPIRVVCVFASICVGKEFITFPATGLVAARTKCTEIGARLPSYGERDCVSKWLGQNFNEPAWLDLKAAKGIYYVAQPTQGQSSQFIDRSIRVVCISVIKNATCDAKNFLVFSPDTSVHTTIAVMKKTCMANGGLMATKPFQDCAEKMVGAIPSLPSSSFVYQSAYVVFSASGQITATSKHPIVCSKPKDINVNSMLCDGTNIIAYFHLSLTGVYTLGEGTSVALCPDRTIQPNALIYTCVGKLMRKNGDLGTYYSPVMSGDPAGFGILVCFRYDCSETDLNFTLPYGTLLSYDSAREICQNIGMRMVDSSLGMSGCLGRWYKRVGLTSNAWYENSFGENVRTTVNTLAGVVPIPSEALAICVKDVNECIDGTHRCDNRNEYCLNTDTGFECKPSAFFKCQGTNKQSLFYQLGGDKIVGPKQFDYAVKACHRDGAKLATVPESKNCIVPALGYRGVVSGITNDEQFFLYTPVHNGYSRVFCVKPIASTIFSNVTCSNGYAAFTPTKDKNKNNAHYWTFAADIKEARKICTGLNAYIPSSVGANECASQFMRELKVAPITTKQPKDSVFYFFSESDDYFTSLTNGLVVCVTGGNQNQRNSNPFNVINHWQVDISDTINLFILQYHPAVSFKNNEGNGTLWQGNAAALRGGCASAYKGTLMSTATGSFRKKAFELVKQNQPSAIEHRRGLNYVYHTSETPESHTFITVCAKPNVKRYTTGCQVSRNTFVTMSFGVVKDGFKFGTIDKQIGCKTWFGLSKDSLQPACAQNLLRVNSFERFFRPTDADPNTLGIKICQYRRRGWFG